MPQLSRLPKSLEIGLTAEDQVSEHSNLWGTVHIHPLRVKGRNTMEQDRGLWAEGGQSLSRDGVEVNTGYSQ